jgi:hypothetical protein
MIGRARNLEIVVAIMAVSEYRSAALISLMKWIIAHATCCRLQTPPT